MRIAQVVESKGASAPSFFYPDVGPQDVQRHAWLRPLFAHREQTPLLLTIPLARRAALTEALRAVLAEAQVLADEQEAIILADPRAEVSLRTPDGAPMLEITSVDPDLATRIRSVISEFLATDA